jgi:hypothetical protein
MSATVGGSIESISIRGRLFAVASDADASRKLGGFENEIQSNGDGSARIVKTRVPWSLSGIVVDINEDRADQEFLQEISDEKDYVTMAITFASGVTYQGRGMITGEMQMASQASTAELNLMGPGELTQQ